MTNTTYPRCFFDIQFGNRPVSVSTGRIVMEMYQDTCPRTVANFISLCQGDQISAVSGKQLHYKGSGFHRVIKSFMIQGGDFTRGDGTGGESIYGEKFEDEDFSRLHERPGLLSMANAGPNTNGSQFFITTCPTPHLNGKHVVFGRVIKGMSVVRSIENCEKGANDKPLEGIMIADCGVLAEGEEDGIPIPDDGDVLPEYTEDHDLIPEDHPTEYIAFASQIKTIGNTLLKQALASTDPTAAQSFFSKAIAKYEKAVRYLEAINPSPEEATELTYEAKLEFFALKVSCLSNLSLASGKISDWAGQQRYSERILSIAETLATYTVKHSTTPLMVTPADQSKAYFRVGQALVKQLQYEQGCKMLERAQSLTSGTPDAMIIKTINETQRMIKERAAKEKRMYQKMFE
ncbi:hypothetical protein BDV3_003244 [Batrachochytrium dendrobatidis]